MHAFENRSHRNYHGVTVIQNVHNTMECWVDVIARTEVARYKESGKSLSSRSLGGDAQYRADTSHSDNESADLHMCYLYLMFRCACVKKRKGFRESDRRLRPLTGGMNEYLLAQKAAMTPRE